MATATKPDETKVWILRVARVIVWVIYLFVLAALILLTLAFFLRLFGANPAAGFTEWVYRSVDRIMEPFRGIFPSHAITDTSVLDFSLLFAMIIYAIFALVAHWLVQVVSERLARLTAPPPAPPPGVPQQYVVTGPPVTNVNVAPPAPESPAAPPGPWDQPVRGPAAPGPWDQPPSP
jgi:uncharacterized protein YggT (Ycf19 family)